jgi:two-component system phosphate regulon sensor histidine kinase PhoR
VLADSGLDDLAAVRALESHANRREFVSAVARTDGIAVDRRVSPTLGEAYRYLAMRIGPKDAPTGVVRAALPGAPIAAQMAALRQWMWTIAALAALASVAAAYLIAAHLTDPLRSLADAAQALVEGRYDQRLTALSSGATDEVSMLARALGEVGNRLAQRDRQLSSTNQTQATVLEGMNECVLAVDRDEHVLFANASAGRVLGFNAQDASGLTLLEAVRSHELRDAVQQAFRTRRTSSAELAIRGKSSRTLEVLATPLPGNPAPGVVVVMRDVTELKRLENMRQQFIANVSHELKTPLSSIKAYTETLLGGARHDAEHCERFLERIDEQAGRLHQLIQDMLSLARIESGQAALEVTNVSVERTVERSLADYEALAAAREVTLENAVGDSSLHVRGDEEAVRQVLSNLIDNAVKYTPPGGRVSIAARRDEGMVVIEVSDTGAGIAPEHLGRLFERFYRVDKARSRELGGTGLGLSIVKHLCQAMGGTVAVQSQLNRGSTFIVRLPLAAGSAD